MSWYNPIFETDVNEHTVKEQKREDGSIEVYATYFRARSAYISIPITHPWAKMDQDLIPTEHAHGGITWSSELLPNKISKKGSWFLGWDFNHGVSSKDM